MSRYDSNVRCVITVCRRDSRIACPGKGAGYSRDNFEIYCCLGASLSFLSTPPKKKWVTALESDDNVILFGFFDKEFIYFGLGYRMPAGEFADRYHFSSWFSKVKQFRGYQMVV